jgi:hypothetical protein
LTYLTRSHGKLGRSIASMLDPGTPERVNLVVDIRTPSAGAYRVNDGRSLWGRR